MRLPAVAATPSLCSMPLLRITQGVGLKLKLATLNFGDIELEIIDEATIDNPTTTFSAILTTFPSAVTPAAGTWQDIPSAVGQFTVLGTTTPGSGLFSLNLDTGEMLCNVPGDYMLLGNASFDRNAPLNSRVAWSVNNDVPIGTTTEVAWESQEDGNDSTTGGSTAYTPIRRVTLAAGDSVRLRFRNINASAPGTAFQNVQLAAWRVR